MGLPWWLSGKESACLGRRRQGFSPSSRKIPHAMEQLSPHATTIKPVLQNPGATATEPTTLQPHKSACARAYALQQEKPNDEKPALQLESSPCSL